MNLNDYVASIQDFPVEGILFRDITPLMQDGAAFHEACRQLIEYAKKIGAEVIVGPESRGFIFGCPVAYELNIGFVPVRKPNKLPRKTVSVKYDLEYGSNELHMHEDSIKPGQKVLIIDDLLATGGTVEATVKLIEKLGGEVAGCAFLIELEDLKGRERLKDYDVFTLMTY
ncbi:MAG: adenine phosphoribosyltransferase [Erysipelotrichaceae bacterium]|jgi:adenine phosphoribosyltransferase|nr:adenine phosphoribosyltransferase [Erysipelotrichaceae bacterium]MBQ1512575.1 adenine phosphoribosyltransferase [Erysipelotrichaceae bacterium]MBQ1809525.1 adenine phosphoribosyltransferase [Erysipelotrichaceae bacterium]MBQ5755800.1 adenine phosphoribosyltransferase [Erysipelotrichaceae bacterium]MBR3150515.1 adenine phosphoribosyltransferase [Erysipelotrichaceae bacterium]